MKRRTKSGAEYDVTSRWRSIHTYLSRAGVSAGIKRQMRRRERHEWKSEDEDDEK